MPKATWLHISLKISNINPFTLYTDMRTSLRRQKIYAPYIMDYIHVKYIAAASFVTVHKNHFRSKNG